MSLRSGSSQAVTAFCLTRSQWLCLDLLSKFDAGATAAAMIDSNDEFHSGHQSAEWPILPNSDALPGHQVQQCKNLAKAMKLAIKAGRLTYVSGRMSKPLLASSSSPISGVVRW